MRASDRLSICFKNQFKFEEAPIFEGDKTLEENIIFKKEFDF